MVYINMKEAQILIISPEPWNEHFVSKHHYAITLAKQGIKVFFLNPPDNRVSDIDISDTKYKNLKSITSPNVAKGLRFYPKVLRIYREQKWLEKLEKRIGQKFNTIWLFENSRFYDMGFAGTRLKIYHQVDSNQIFHQKVASSSADINFCTTEYIHKELCLNNQKTFKISHGINMSIDKMSLTDNQKKRFLMTSKNIAYIGNLDMKYIHEELLHELVLNYPNSTFHFIGAYSKNANLYILCGGLKNIIWWGKVESSLIINILEYIDITLLLYRAEEYKEQLASPHKILEYLYSTKVTVATYTDEYKDKRHLLEMVDSSDEYLEKFQEVIENLAFYNSKEKQAKRRAFAKEHSYEKQLEKIFKYLKCYNIRL